MILRAIDLCSVSELTLPYSPGVSYIFLLALVGLRSETINILECNGNIVSCRFKNCVLLTAISWRGPVEVMLQLR